MNKLDTHWPQVRKFGKPADARQPDLDQLLVTYWRAAHSYLRALVGRDEELASELADEFALRLQQGAYSNASPEKGRFRDYIKIVLRNLVTDHFRKVARANEVNLDPDFLSSIDREFQSDLHAVIMESAWRGLGLLESEHGTPYRTALDVIAASPQISMTDLASVLGERMGKSFNANGVRQIVHRARTRLAELIVDRVATTCNCKNEKDLREELDALGFLGHCQSALDEWTRAAKS